MGASFVSAPGAPGPDDAAQLVAQALEATAARRRGIDAPSDYARAPHPWTDAIAFALCNALDKTLKAQPSEAIHAVSWDKRDILSRMPDIVQAEARWLYDIAWRVYPPDRHRLYAQRLALMTGWRGGWPALAGAADKLAQARTDLRALIVLADPERAVGDMSLVEALAYRISAFASAGEACLFAFWSAEGGWRGSEGFTVFRYRTGDGALERLPERAV